MVLVTTDLQDRLQQAINYLSARTEKYNLYIELIDSLKLIQSQSIASNSNGSLEFKQQANRTINRYFEGEKRTVWQNINRRKYVYLSGKNSEHIQQIINQLPHRCNRLAQNYLRVFKQYNNQNKLNIVNPFSSNSLMYRVQNAIQEAEVIDEKKQHKTYLRLVLKNKIYTEAIHTYVMNVCQQSLNDWLTDEWQNIENNYNGGGLNKLQQQLQLEIQPLANLCRDITITQSTIEPSLQLNDYICLSALENNSQIPFDYHYTQSTWFRLLVAIIIGTIIFILTERLFGFILLFVQFVNLLTGQDARKIRLRQHTKEIKRILDGKYQFLIRFLVDKVAQDIAISLDNINQNYQEQIDIITQEASQKLQQIKQETASDREKIDELKKTHLKLQKILDD